MKVISIAWSLNSCKGAALEKDTLNMPKMRIVIVWSNLAFLVC